MRNELNRRCFLGVAGALASTGCIATSTGTTTETADPTPTDEPDPLEKGGFEIANIKPQRLWSYNGITATVYNDTAEWGRVTVLFTIYRGSGEVMHEGTDSVSLEPGEQAPISKYWERGSDKESWQLWDVKISSVTRR